MINNACIYTKCCKASNRMEDCNKPIGKLNIHSKNYNKIAELDKEITNARARLNNYSNSLLAQIDAELLSDAQHIKRLETELNSLQINYNAMVKIFHTNPLMAVPERMHGTMHKIDELKYEIHREQGILDHAKVRYMQVYHDDINHCEYIEQLNDLIMQYNDCWDQVKHDENKYSRYIECIYRIDVLEDADWFTEFMEEVDNISDEDDQYLKSICDGYKGSTYYIKRAAHVLTQHEADKRLYESSLADEVILDPRTIGLDPWSMRAQRKCYESYVRDVIAKSDSSIFGIKI